MVFTCRNIIDSNNKKDDSACNKRGGGVSALGISANTGIAAVEVPANVLSLLRFCADADCERNGNESRADNGVVGVGMRAKSAR